MRSPIDIVREWLEADPAWVAAQFKLARGMWRDSTADASRKMAVLSMNGGRGPQSVQSYTIVSLILLGPQKANAAGAVAIENIAIGIQDRLFTDYKACGAAQIRLIGGIIGPGYTTEDRPWIELSLEILT